MAAKKAIVTVAELPFDGYASGVTSVRHSILSNHARTELHISYPPVPSEVYYSKYVAIRGPTTERLGPSEKRNFRPPPRKGGPARGKVKKQSREIRSKMATGSKGRRHEKSYYLIRSDATEKDKNLRQSSYHITVVCNGHCFVLPSKA